MEARKYSTFELRDRAVTAVKNGQEIGVVAEAYQVHRTTLYRWCVRCDDGGPGGLKRQRDPGSGRPRLLSLEDEWHLYNIVLNPASTYGYETDFWSCRRLIQVVRKKLRVSVSQPTMGRILREWGLTYKKPEREYFEGSEELRREWIKKTLPMIKRAVKEYRAILYFEDEASISLTAILGKTWGPRGETTAQKVTGKRGSVSAMSALSGTGRLVFTLHDKRIASDEVIHFLSELLRHHLRRHLVVVMDRAPPHVSKKTLKFIDGQRRLHVFHLPKYSPKFNPDEYVWNHLKHQELKGHQEKSKEGIKRLARSKLRKMSKDPGLLRGIFFRCRVADLLN